MQVPFLKPRFGQDEIDAVSRVMRTANLTNGPETTLFEEEFADYIGTRYAVAVNSGTSALELVLQSMIYTGRIERRAGVIIPSFTFVAVANAVVNAGLVPVFADISPNTMNIDLDNITLDNNPVPIQAIIPVHTFGLSCDMYEMVDFASKHGLVIIEDCAEALGAAYAGYRVGSLGDCGIFSFTPTKNMTTCEGGMITTNNESLADVIKLLRSHGISPGATYYRDTCLPGHNMRMSEITAAIGRVQLEKLEWMNTERMRNTILLNKLISEKDLPVMLSPKLEQLMATDHACQMFTVQLLTADHRLVTCEERDAVLAELIKRGIDAKVYFYPPIHQQTLYKDHHFYCSVTGMDVTEAVSRRVITLPMYPELTEAEIEYMADCLAWSIKAVLG